MLPIVLSEQILGVLISSITSRTIVLRCTPLLVPLKSDGFIAFMLWEGIYASDLGGGSRGRNA